MDVRGESKPPVNGPQFGLKGGGFDQIKSPAFWRACIAEFFGMTLFLFFTIATVNSSSDYSNAKLDGGRVWMISSVFGFMITILVYITADVSGGSLNPAVSFGLLLQKQMTLAKFIFYTIFQCLGAAFGCFLVSVIFDGHFIYAINSIQSYQLDGEEHKYSFGAAFLGELVGTALLVFAVSAAVDDDNKHIGLANFRESHAAMAIGLCVTMAHCVLIPITNCSINPARAFGASLVAGDFTDHGVMWLGPFVGALFSAVLYQVVVKTRGK